MKKTIKIILVCFISTLLFILGFAIVFCEVYFNLPWLFWLFFFYLGLIIAFITILAKTHYSRFVFFPKIRGFFFSKFYKKGKIENLRIGKGTTINNPSKISLGVNVDIANYVGIFPLSSKSDFPSKIVIGNNVHIGAYDRIASAYKVSIEDDVLIAAFVQITDHSHDYFDIDKPIVKQSIMSKGEVIIKKGAWLGFGSMILSGVTIGVGSVVAANAVVTHNVPDHTVVAGCPATPIKFFNSNTAKWETISHGH